MLSCNTQKARGANMQIINGKFHSIYTHETGEPRHKEKAESENNNSVNSSDNRRLVKWLLEHWSFYKREIFQVAFSARLDKLG